MANTNTRMSVLYDASKCTACQACSVACKQWNDLPAEKTVITTSIQSHDNFTPKTWTFIRFKETFENNKMEWNFRKNQCMHCGEAGCIKACSYDAISRTETGFVVIDHQKCIGCGYCTAGCPFNVPRVDEQKKKSYKCTGCPERTANGMIPACVATCQPEALVYGEREQIVKMAEARVKALLPKYPKANVYGAKDLKGLNFTYVLLREPEYYGLPAVPAVSLAITTWKDIVRPLGMLSIAGTLTATAVSYMMTRGKNNEQEDKSHDNK